jgi:ribosomal-protein-alanine N-acetyltransferase
MNILDIEAVVMIEEENFSMPWSKTDFEDELKNPKAMYFVAIENGELVGFSGLWNIVNEGNITNIAIKKQYQQQGIGTKLVEEMIERAKEDGINALTLEVRVSNKRAQHVYEKIGFEGVGIRKSFYQQPNEDALIMWYRILEEGV